MDWQPGGASWIKHLSKLTDEVITYNDEFYRARLQALQAVDELIEGLVTRLSDFGILEDTYILYTTDNGYHISQHRLNPGKECGFEEDINIPLIVRGPGVPAGGEADIVTAHTDLAPTILKLAGGNWKRGDLDGSPIPLDEKSIAREKSTRQEHVNVEFWGRGIPEGIYRFSLDDGKVGTSYLYQPPFPWYSLSRKLVSYGSNNTYKALRVIGQTYNLSYSVWCTNEHELYDLTTDPYQITNIYPSSASASSAPLILGLPLFKVLPRLDALLMVTKSCKGHTCTHPWEVIHPQGDVTTLADALDERFDAFYLNEVASRIKFEKCELGYIVESEGPQDVVGFDAGSEYL
jgi:N-acetylglucosamine-6-sulfatase